MSDVEPVRGRPEPLRAVHVVVPARNEEALLPGALAALRAAVDHLTRTRPGVRADVTVVLDACTDATPDLVAAAGWVHAHHVTSGTVGAARSAGVDAAEAVDVPDRVWVASTDADSRVPVDWLSVQVDLADGGADLVLGTVEPDPTDTSAAQLAAWHRRHRLADGHAYVHGANLGIRLSAYRAAGGFGAVAAHEDVRLAHRARVAGAVVVATDRIRVTTSGRATGRAPAGFAGYVRSLAPRLNAGTTPGVHPG
ncbi:glycosyl transferase [Tersicoccus solisilvae]|uniref:4,4'-diaponeurosporenoate glycosyltransferase n=1 Tax=Tersicoccus solisilvae TaxID=1882339 RepID=A0ABQ1NI17_9MICC|nr:glycosyltransferase [Tersicoccus solisilvae]GGC77775.1 glycosyl transferase [Tersicoccus solisilvae]